jgi:lipooligosaccharide transport system permease protein
MTATATDLRRPAWTRLVPGARATAGLRIVERNALAWKNLWLLFLSNIFEAAFFLLSIGVGVGGLVGDVTVPSGTAVPYRVFVGAGMLASSAMFGPVFDTTFGFFVKLKYGKLYDGVLATPLAPVDVARGELVWAVLRGTFYAAFFLATMVALGFVRSWWALLAVPVAALIGYAFAATGLAAATWMRSFIDFDLVHITLLPLFLFSTIFFPLDRYPAAFQWIVQVTPLYQGVVLERALVLGEVGPWLIAPALYLLVMGTVGLAVAGRRMQAILQP